MKRFSNLFFDEKPDDGHEYFKAYGIQNNIRFCKWFRRDWINNPIPFNKYKVLVPKANGTGALGEVVSTPLVGLPLVGNTASFITVGAFDTRAESEACNAYIKTRFCRVMLGILKVTQDNSPASWAKVPLQDFTSRSDIDWGKTIHEIDLQLYAKYKLTAEEINFIESKVQAMS